MDTSVARKTNAPDFATAYYLLEGLNEIGIEYLFCNFGTDHAPIIDEMAHRRKLGEAMPSVVRCPHENTAAHMAAGYALVTGRGQGVLVHVDVGTANTANAMHNIYRSRLPVLLMAGKAPYTANDELVGSRDTYVHFVQEPFDQASLVRPYLKWEWTLPSGVVVKEALRRALFDHAERAARPGLSDDAARDADPALEHRRDPALSGRPVRRDGRRRRRSEARGRARRSAADGGKPDPDHRLCRAQCHAARTIDALAQFAGIAVYEANMTNNISHESPCFVGFAPDKAVPNADVGILVDVDVPWFPSDVQTNDKSFWAHIDIDTLKPGSPMWTFPGNLRMQGDSGRILEQVLDELKAKATPRFKAAAAARLERIKAAREERVGPRRQARGGQRQARRDQSALPDGGARQGARRRRHHLQRGRHQCRRGADADAAPLPNTTMRSGGGGLGWSGGMALGAKLAAPKRMMVQVSGDGGFYFGNPSSVFAVSQQYKLPIFSIVMDNTGWNAVKASTLRVFPEGEAKSAGEFEAELAPKVAFTKVGEAFGAYGEESAIPPTFRRRSRAALKEVRGGRAALLHARVTQM